MTTKNQCVFEMFIGSIILSTTSSPVNILNASLDIILMIVASSSARVLLSSVNHRLADHTRYFSSYPSKNNRSNKSMIDVLKYISSYFLPFDHLNLSKSSKSTSTVLFFLCVTSLRAYPHSVVAILCPTLFQSFHRHSLHFC